MKENDTDIAPSKPPAEIVTEERYLSVIFGSFQKSIMIYILIMFVLGH